MTEGLLSPDIKKIRDIIIPFVKETNKTRVADQNKVKEINKLNNDIIGLAVMKLFTIDEYFSNFILLIQRDIDYTYPAPAAVTFSSDMNYHLIINPISLYQTASTIPEVSAILQHEALHILHRHIQQYSGLENKENAMQINVGSDCAINQEIQGLPDGCVTLQNLNDITEKNLSANQDSVYYVNSLNNKKAKKNMKDMFGDKADTQNNSNGSSQQSDGSSSDNQQQGNQNGQGNQTDDSDNNSNNKQSDSSSSDNNSDNQQQGKAGNQVGDLPNGNGSGNNGLDGKGPISGLPGGGNQFGKVSMEHEHDSWKKAEKYDPKTMDDSLKEIGNVAANRTRGDIPTMIKETLDKLNEPAKLNWKSVLKRGMGRIRVPYRMSINRMNRHFPRRLDLKGRTADHIMDIYVAVDTSGSMGSDELKYCFREIFGMLKTFNSFKLTIIENDAEIHNVYEAKDIHDVTTTVHGRGGELKNKRLLTL